MIVKLLKISMVVISLGLLQISTNPLLAQKDDKNSSVRPWKGFAILGNGSHCAVYSDDIRTKGKGIQNLYFNDFTCSYVGSSVSGLYQKGSNISIKKIGNDSLGMANFFTTTTRSYFDNKVVKEVQCYAHPEKGIILSIKVSGKFRDITQSTQIFLNKLIITDRKTTLQKLSLDKGQAIAEWSNHNVMIIASKNPSQKISINDSVVSVSGKISANEKIEIVITIDKSLDSSKSNISRLLSNTDLSVSATTYWNNWMNKGIVPKFSTPEEDVYNDYYKRNLYSVKAATLNGFVPSDITGYFVTNKMPQLYPRDAMMCARVFLLTGHLQEAKEIIDFWNNHAIKMKSKGEWYARYDAYTNAVNAGSGARYDEPEWDANGYFIQLIEMYHQKTKTWLVEPKEIYELADFLVDKIDTNGLLFEGGIVEWSGYLPSTNMTAAAALKTASRIASEFGNSANAKKYEMASEKIASSLGTMFDKSKNSYADLRFIGNKGKHNESIKDNTGDTLYLWNTTMNFGVLWGYPNHRAVELSNAYYQEHNVKNGGVQYFDAPDQGLASYGNCMFIFSTAARAQYMALYGDRKIAKTHIDWMVRNVNTYGLMPERIALDDSDLTPASPLSWCSAEFVAALLFYKK